MDITTPVVELVAVQPVRAYDKSSLDQFVIAAEHERERLQAALDRATRRRLIAEQRATDAAGVRARLAEMVVETQRRVARLKQENRRVVAAILAAAEAEAEALLAAGRAEGSLFTPFSHRHEPASSAEPVKVELTVVPAV